MYMGWMDGWMDSKAPPCLHLPSMATTFCASICSSSHLNPALIHHPFPLPIPPTPAPASYPYPLKERSFPLPRHGRITNGAASRKMLLHVVASATESSSSTATPRISNELEITRRKLTNHLLFSLIILPAFPSFASDGKQDEYMQYLDEDDKYSLLIPSDWVKGSGKATAQRNVTAFFPTDDLSANVNILITGVGADYTSLSSFGTVDAFAENLVNSLDRSWKKPPGQIAKLVNCRSSNGFYYIEYTFQQPQEKKKHLLSVVGMRFNGWYNRLYTVTGQYLDDDNAKYGPLVEKAITSFKFA